MWSIPHLSYSGEAVVILDYQILLKSPPPPNLTSSTRPWTKEKHGHFRTYSLSHTDVLVDENRAISKKVCMKAASCRKPISIRQIAFDGLDRQFANPLMQLLWSSTRTNLAARRTSRRHCALRQFAGSRGSFAAFLAADDATPAIDGLSTSKPGPSPAKPIRNDERGSGDDRWLTRSHWRNGTYPGETANTQGGDVQSRANAAGLSSVSEQLRTGGRVHSVATSHGSRGRGCVFIFRWFAELFLKLPKKITSFRSECLKT